MSFGNTSLALAWLTLVSIASGLEAEVRIVVRADGTKVMVGSGSKSNKGPSAKPRSYSFTPRPAPAEIESWIRENADRASLDADLIRAVIQVESGFNPKATSSKGAMGLMQLMPGTAASLAVSDPYDPRQNIQGGTAYLSQMIRNFGRTDLALAGYNAGPGAVQRYGGIPPYRETRDYVEKVLRIYRRDPDYQVPKDAHPTSGGGSKGRTYLYRDPNGSLVMTTEPPK